MIKHTPWMIHDRKIKIAVLGLGRISKNHLQSIEQHKDNLQLVAVCDARQEFVEQVSKQYQVQGYLHLDEMLEQSDADIVTVCTPSGLHPMQTIQIAQSGRHIITEKPMATRWQDGVDMVRACEKAGVRLFVVKQNRLNATLQMLKKAIDEGRFGRIYMANINVFWTRPQDYYDQDAWRGTWALDGGAFMNQASHYVDLAHWLIGPVQSVQAMMGTLERKIEAEDTGVLNIRWRNGAMGSVSVTMLTYPKNLEGSITILGEKGTVRIGGVAVNEIQTWDFSEPQEEDAEVAKANYQTNSVYGYGHALYYDNVIKTLRGEAEAETDGREGLKSLELLVAMYISSRDGKRVKLPLVF